ncbi:MAG: putative integral rane protein [Bacteroidota bacterium]|nr:putative integral rane protein [Bacteroidota bacterium]
MRKLLIGILVFASLAFVTQWLAIKYIPNIIYKIAVRRGKEINTWIHNGKTDASMRRVVLPNPDFIYSALFYDVNDKDLTISGTLPDSTYASVAFYDDRCQPYYVYNNQSLRRTGKFAFQLSRLGLKGPNQLQAKTNKGIIICRFLLTGDSSFQKMSAFQRQLFSK